MARVLDWMEQLLKPAEAVLLQPLPPGTGGSDIPDHVHVEHEEGLGADHVAPGLDVSVVIPEIGFADFDFDAWPALQSHVRSYDQAPFSPFSSGMKLVATSAEAYGVLRDILVYD